MLLQHSCLINQRHQAAHKLQVGNQWPASLRTKLVFWGSHVRILGRQEDEASPCMTHPRQDIALAPTELFRTSGAETLATSCGRLSRSLHNNSCCFTPPIQEAQDEHPLTNQPWLLQRKRGFCERLLQPRTFRNKPEMLPSPEQCRPGRNP